MESMEVLVVADALMHAWFDGHDGVDRLKEDEELYMAYRDSALFSARVAIDAHNRYMNAVNY